MAKGKKTGGRKAGTPNKLSKTLKEDILNAAEMAHPEGRVAYLIHQAHNNATAFMSLLGKVLPMEVQNLDKNGNPADQPAIKVEFVTKTHTDT